MRLPFKNAFGAALLAAAEGRSDALAPGVVRGRCNTLVLNATQAYLTARKGTGFLRTEPAQRWARQALAGGRSESARRAIARLLGD